MFYYNSPGKLNAMGHGLRWLLFKPSSGKRKRGKRKKMKFCWPGSVTGESRRPCGRSAMQRAGPATGVGCQSCSALPPPEGLFFWLDRGPQWSLPSLSSMSMLFLEILTCHSPGHAFNTQNLWVEKTLISKLWLWQDELLHHFMHL